MTAGGAGLGVEGCQYHTQSHSGTNFVWAIMCGTYLIFLLIQMPRVNCKCTSAAADIFRSPGTGATPHRALTFCISGRGDCRGPARRVAVLPDEVERERLCATGGKQSQRCDVFTVAMAAGHHTDMMKWLQVNVYMPWVNYSSWLMTTPALLFQIQDIVGRRE